MGAFFASDERFRRFIAEEEGERYEPTGYLIAFESAEERAAYLADRVEPEFEACTHEEALSYGGAREVERWDAYCAGHGDAPYVPYEWREN